MALARICSQPNKIEIHALGSSRILGSQMKDGRIEIGQRRLRPANGSRDYSPKAVLRSLAMASS